VDNFDKNLKASLTGDITVHEEIYGMMNRDNRILIPVAILLVAVIILLVFKRISDVFVALVIVGLGSMWAVGTMGLLQLDFTMFHVALVPLLLGLGVDYSVHMLNRYYEEIGRGRPVKRAIFTSITTVGVAVSISTLTTMIGFSSFVTSSLVPFRTLGIFAALGILFTFILSITLLPAALVLRDRKMARDLKATITMREKRVNKLLTFTAAAAERHWKPITAAAVAVAALCAISAVGIPTTMSVELFVPEHVESVAALNRINEKFGGQSTIFVLAGGDVTSPEGLREMLMLENSVLHDKENPENLIRGAWSLADAVSLAGGGQIPADGEIVAEIIQQLEPAAKLLSGGTAVIYFFVNARTDEEGRLATEIIRRNVGEFKGKALDLTIDGEPAVGGEPVVITDILSSITPTLFNSTVVTIILCFLVLAILFRSLTTGLIALLPLLLTISWEFGTLRILGWPLDVLTMGISALIIGLGVDYSVHVIHRFREERERHGAQLAVRSTIMNIGTAMLTAATTTIGVFAVLSLSGMPAMGRFGVLTALVISYGIISALMILPSILVFRTSRGGKQAGL
jgi:hydrophobe/amphiphile efflux-3 (HAE3) family protein